MPKAPRERPRMRGKCAFARGPFLRRAGPLPQDPFQTALWLLVGMDTTVEDDLPFLYLIPYSSEGIRQHRAPVACFGAHSFVK